MSKVKKAKDLAAKLRRDAKKLERAVGVEGQFLKIEEAIGFRDRTHRHREAKKHNLPIGSGDQAPTLDACLKIIWDKMVELSLIHI